MSSGIHVNVRTHGFQAEHCIDPRLLMLDNLNVSGFNVVAHQFQ